MIRKRKIMNIRTILKFIDKGNKRWYDRDIDESLAYVASFDEPKDLWQRSYYQYLCQRYDMALWRKIMLNIVSGIIFPFAIIYLRFSHLAVRFVEHLECVSDCSDVKPMVPESLKQQYSIDYDTYYNAGYGLSHRDIKYLFGYFFHYLNKPTFLLHITFKIARYGNIIRKYRPEVIICHNEYSYSSSALTDFCRHHSITHINIMHGERLINIRNAFFEYDKCYVWHEHYKSLYILLRSGTKPEDFIIEVPKALKIDKKNDYDKNAFANYKYYLGDQTLDELRHIVDSLTPLKQKGFSVKFRPHPRYTDFDDLSKLVPKEEIEWPSEIDIATSIASCDYVIGSFSTVLLQAFLCGRGCLIDDITYANRIELQRKAKHILFSSGAPELLSSHIAHKVEL